MTRLKKTILALLIVVAPTLHAQEKVALIETVAPEHATGIVAQVYSEVKQEWHMVPNPIKLYSTNPEMLKQRWEGYKQLGQHKTVDAKLQTVIRMLVSAEHDCQYCIGLNESILINDFKLDPEKVMAMKKDSAAAPLPEKDHALLQFVMKAVKDSKSTDKKDIAALHKLGWTDAEIFFATSYAADMVASDILINAFQVAIDY